MIRFSRIGAAVLLLLTVLLIACASAPTSTKTTQPSVIHDATPTPTARPTRPPTRTPMATPTPLTPTITPSPTSTPCLDNAPPVALPPRKTPLEVKFIGDGNIWIWREQEGSARQISDTGDARSMIFSDDGQVIAFERGVDQHRVELWAVNRDGTKLRRLVSAAEFDAMGSYSGALANVPINIQWISGTHRLRFGARPVFDAIGYMEYKGQWEVDADTSKLRVLQAAGQPVEVNLDQYGVRSPDRRQIAKVTTTSLSLVNADGTKRRDNVLTYPFIGLGDYAYTPLVVWSPDSTFLRAIIPSAKPFDPDATLSTWMVPADGLAPRRVATFSGFPLDVHLSPNQQYIAFWKPIQPMSNTRELHLAKFDGTREIIYYTAHVLEFGGWAPDSVHFVFTYGPSDRAQLGQICGGFAPLTDAPSTGGIDWVDSTRFLFIGPDGLYLGGVGGTSILIGRSACKRECGSLQFNRDPAALGETQ